MSWHRADHRDRQPPRTDAYGRQAYQLPPTVAQREIPPPFVDPLELVERPRGYPERDSGWGNRRPRNSHVAPVSRADPRGTAGTYDVRQDPRQATRGWTSDPRARPTPTPSPTPAPFVAQALEVADFERKLEYLLRTIDGRLHKELADKHARWTRLDTRLLSQVIEEHRRHQEEEQQGTMRMKTMRTALAHYRILLQCQAEQRADPVERFEDLRNHLQNLVFDICEEPNVPDRVEGYRALLDLCRRDVTLVKSNVSALVQVLENDGDNGRERSIIYDVLYQHLKLANEVEEGDPLTDCLRLMFPRNLKPEVRGMVVDFFESDWGEEIIGMILGDIWHEAVLAICFADALPLASDSDILKVIELLHKIQSIWVGPQDVVSEGKRVAAVHAAVTVLWSLSRVLMDQAGVFVFPSVEEDSAWVLSPSLTRLLNRFDISSKEQNIENGIKTFSHLCSAIDRLIADRPQRQQEATLLNLSEARRFLDELALSTLYPFCYLPVDTVETETILDHFDAAQKIVLFRSMANLAAQVASAEKKRPQELDFGGDSKAADLAKAAARALMDYVPTKRATLEKSNEAYDAYTMLAAEALLTTIHQCESCMADEKAGPITFSDVKDTRTRHDRLQSLISLAEEILEARKADKEVVEAAEVVLCLATENLRWKCSDDAKLTPTWLMEPPPFPEWVKPQLGIPTRPPSDISAKPAGSRRAGRKRKGSRAEQPEERRVRGRGAVHAFMNDDSATAAATDQMGITIRGTSRAGHRSPNYMPADVYRPGRRAAGSGAESATSASADRNDVRVKSEVDGGGRIKMEDDGVRIKTEEQVLEASRSQSR